MDYKWIINGLPPPLTTEPNDKNKVRHFSGSCEEGYGHANDNSHGLDGIY